MKSDYKQYDTEFFCAPKKKFKVALIQPLIPDGNYLPNLGIMYLASLLLRDGFIVEIFDENLSGNIVDKVIDFEPNIVGITCVTASMGKSSQLIGKIKNKLSDVVAIIGGPHITALPKETLERYMVYDFGMVGESEKSFIKFCHLLSANIEYNASEDLFKIGGLVYRKNDHVIYNRQIEFLEGMELDQLPFPAWHLLPIESIFKKATHGLFSKGKRIMPVMTTRGCPNYCGFCCRVMGFTFRKRSIDNVILEIQWLVEKFNIDELYFEDDTFTQEPQRAHELLDRIIELDLGIYIKFANGLRADKVDRDLLTKMINAGVYWVGFGIESGSAKTQKLMKKNLDLSLAASNVALAKSMGLKVGSNCIIGYPGEKIEYIKESVNYFLDLKLDSFACVTCIPFPGTTAWQVCETNGWFTEKANDYDNYWFEVFKVSPLIQTPFLSSKQLSRIIFWVYVRFYILNFQRAFLVAKILIKQRFNHIRSNSIYRWVRLLRSNSKINHG